MAFSMSAHFYLLLVAVLSLFSYHAAGSQLRRTAPHAPGHWVAAWTTMPQLTEPANLPNPPFNTSGLVFFNSTIRQTIYVTQPSSRIRLRISNAFGPTTLPITAVTIARPFNGTTGSSAIDTSTLQKVTFGGASSFDIPNAALVVSDPIEINVKAQTELTISIFLAQGQVGNSITSHPGSRTTTWMTFGDQTTAANISDASRQSAEHWYFITTLDAWVPKTVRTLAIVGDSITDGRASTENGNDRWPDQLLSRLLKSPATSSIAIANQAAGGNRILADGLGPNAIGRFDRDVLAQPGVAWSMIFEGVNDIGTADATTAAQQAVGDAVIGALKQMVLRSHAAGIPIFGATITPFSEPGFTVTVQPYSSAVREQTRQRVNDFIRNGGWFDAVVDFDAAVRNKTNPAQLDDAFNSGDFLHPGVAGYTAMAKIFPTNVFAEFANGVDGFA